MRINLKVPFAEKDLARRRGAYWDRGRRTWYIENAENLGPFLRWMPSHLTRPHAPEKKSKQNSSVAIDNNHVADAVAQEECQ